MDYDVEVLKNSDSFEVGLNAFWIRSLPRAYGIRGEEYSRWNKKCPSCISQAFEHLVDDAVRGG